MTLARSLLRDHAQPVVARLERCTDARAELRSAVAACYKIVMLTIDEKQADAFQSAAKAIVERERP